MNEPNEHYEAVLADLEQMKADAEYGIKAIRRLMVRTGVKQSAPITVVSGAASLDGNPESSLPIQVLRFLNENPGRTFRVEEIGSNVGISNFKTLRGALSRLKRDGKIGRYGRGRYRAARNAQKYDVNDSV